LGGTGDPATSQFAIIPLLIDEPCQYLACWVYTPGHTALGAGSAQAQRNGELIGAATAFAGRTIVVPFNTFVVGADVELELMHPQVANRKPPVSVFNYDAVLTEFVEDKDVAKYGTLPPISVAIKVINTDAVQKDLIVNWIALVWRNC
jgi:hypothetical protein